MPTLAHPRLIRDSVALSPVTHMVFQASSKAIHVREAYLKYWVNTTKHPRLPCLLVSDQGSSNKLKNMIVILDHAITAYHPTALEITSFDAVLHEKTIWSFMR